MIDLYTWTTPNGRKASVMLEELGLGYAVKPINIMADEQFADEFLRISPNNKIPAIVDHDVEGAPLRVFESAAICIYLAEKTGSALLPVRQPARAAVMEWTMFQMASVGPMLGQLGHFALYAKTPVPYAIQRYTDETARILGVMNKRLAEEHYLAGDYSIADILTFPWIDAFIQRMADNAAIDLAALTDVLAWHERVAARPAVQAGMRVPVVD